LLFTSPSRVLSGVAGTPIKHGRGIRQGYYLSSLLFILAIDPLRQNFELATQPSQDLKKRNHSLNISYADDVAVFVAPKKQDTQNLASILGAFREVAELVTYFQKSMVVPIRCHINLVEVLRGLLAIQASFPVKYLGLLCQSYL
jgi:hypothetical protein